MISTKTPFGSLTIGAAAAGIIVQLLAILGIEVHELEPELAAHINALISFVLFAVAIYGRLRARKRIVLGEEAK